MIDLAKGFLSGLMYAGALVIAAPLWMDEWDRPMRRLMGFSV